MKRTLVTIFFVTIVLLLISSANADGMIGSLSWTLSDHVLTISGDGEIPDYSYTSHAPWYGSEIDSIVIENGVTHIGAWAFDHCSAVSISIPETVTSIGDYSIRYCEALESVSIPNGVTEIGTYAFESCTGLQSIYLPESLASVGASVFYKCSNLREVVIPENVTVLPSNLFNECIRLGGVTLPNGLTNIGNSAFAYCNSLTDVYFKGVPDTWQGIAIGAGNDALSSALRHYVYNDNLSWTLTDSVLTITGTGTMPTFSPDAPWDGEAFTSVVIEEGITSISSRAFRGCSSMQLISIPNGVTRIDSSAFQSCSALTEIILPDSIGTIGASAFLGCSSLTQATFGSGLTSIGDTVFSGCSSLVTINCSEDNSKYISVEGVLFNKSQTTLVLFPTGYSGSYEYSGVRWAPSPDKLSHHSVLD